MELIKSNDSKYEEYETLLLERDQIRKESGQIWTSYMQIFGRLLCDIYEEKVECIKRKKMIAYYQRALNHGDMIDPEAMRKYLDQEMAIYQAELERMLKDHEICQNAGVSTAYEVERSKTLYRRLAKLLHPDINPETDRTETLRELWVRIQIAYAKNDVKELSELEVLTRKALKELGAGQIQIDIPDIEEKIGTVRKEIQGLMRSEPYIHRFLLEDEAAVEKKKKELTEELEAYRKYQDELDRVIEEMMKKGGIRIKWRMN